MMKNDNALVSIISPTYNGDKYLPLFLDSVIAQTYRPIELIVVNDGSTDNTETVLRSYKNKFKESDISLFLFCQENKGQAAAINTGLLHFSGEYLMWVDSDDVLLPNNVFDKVSFLREHKECGLVLGQGEIINSDDYDKPIGILKRNKPVGNDNLFNDLIYEQNVVFGPGVIMVRSEAFHKAIPTGQIFESREGQNWQLMLPIAYNYMCGYLDKIVFRCVAHNDSHSRQQRLYQEEINRQNNFETLLLETINRISQMPDGEKEEWKKRIIIKHKTNILMLAKEHKDKKTVELTKKIIRKNGGKIPCTNVFCKRFRKYKKKFKKISPKRVENKIKRMIHYD